MPHSSVKQVYMGKSLQDLKPMHDCGKEIIGRKPDIVRKTAVKVLAQAQQSLKEGDEEKSYVSYMRYIEMMMYIYKTDNIKKSNPLFVQITSSISDCLNVADKLAESLKNRYEALAKREEQQPNVKLEEKGTVDELRKETSKINEQTKKEEPIHNGFSELEISSEKLLEMLSGQTVKILIFDARPSTCFASSHIKFGNCVVNIPEEIIEAGKSAAALEKLLPQNSMELWSKRGLVDLIVLVDWTTKTSDLTQENKLMTLKDILLKWDPTNNYKRTPVILEGGYADWLDRYPMHTTNCRVSPPESFNITSMHKLLDTIVYPDLNDTVSSTVPPLPKVDRSSKPLHNISSVLSNIVNGGNFSAVTTAKNLNNVTPLVQHDTSGIVSMPQSKPDIDRASKAAALQLYEERNHAITSILEKQETLANNTLTLEKSRLKAEEEWEQLRHAKEMEAGEEMRLHLQQKEEELLKNIKNSEREQKEMEKEIQTLRGELEYYRKKEQEESLLKSDKKFTEFEKEVSDRIKDAVKETRKITQQREQKELERITAQRKRQELKDQEKLKLEEKDRRKEQEIKKQEREQPDSTKGIYYAELRHDGPSSSSPMKRSHSSPDLAKLNEIGKFTKSPEVDRANKPCVISRPTSQKTLYHVYGVVEPGLTGLRNLGNTCYMNSILQCLSNTSPLKNFFVEGTYRNFVNKHSDTHGCIVEAVAVVIMSLWSGQYRYFVCDDLKAQVGRFREQFRTSQQQDSNEFLTVLMDWLHEDLKKLKDDSLIIENQGAMSNARRHFIEFKRKNKSFIVNLFYGQQQSTVRCLRCEKESITYETFSNLTLPLPNNNNCSLDDCLKLYLEGERITGWTCPACKEKRDAIKKFDILLLPPILIIHFKRFYVDGWCRKRQTYVDFPVEKLDMNKYLTSSDYSKCHTNFSLYGISNHYGTMEGGHYTAYCKNDLKNKWFKFDDHEVNVISPSSVKTGAAYILFYASVRSTVS